MPGVQEGEDVSAGTELPGLDIDGKRYEIMPLYGLRARIIEVEGISVPQGW